MKYTLLMMALFAGTLSYGQKWEVGSAVGLYNFQNVYAPPYRSFNGTNSFTVPSLNFYLKRKSRHFCFMLNVDYFKRNASALDTVQIPIANTYPRAYKDTIGLYNEWNINYNLIRIDGSYNIFTIKNIKNYIGVSLVVLLNYEQFKQYQTVIDNNSKYLYKSAEDAKDIYIGINYQLSYQLSKHLNIHNIFSLTIGTDPYYTYSLNKWPMMASDNIGVGYVF